MNLVCFVRIAGAALVSLVICACETFPETPFPNATEVGWWNDEGASDPPRSLFTSANRKRTFTRVNVWLANRLPGAPISGKRLWNPLRHFDDRDFVVCRGLGHGRVAQYCSPVPDGA